MKPIFFVLIALEFSLALSAQTPLQARLSFQLEGIKSPMVTLGYYQGGLAYRADSVRLDNENGRFSFQKEDLNPGLYFISIGGSRLFDFVLASASDSFMIQGKMPRLDSLTAFNSAENSAYFAFESERKKLGGRIKAKEELLYMADRATRGNKETLAPIQKDLEKLYLHGDSISIAFTKKHPSNLYAKMLLSVRPPDPPKKLKPTLHEKPNPAFVRWQRKHYFDHTDFKNESLLNNNFWHAFFDGYLTKHVALHPDSVIYALDEVLARMPRNGAFYRFAVLRLTKIFEKYDAPWADQVFVHLVDKYLKKNDTPWLDIATLERLAYKADTHRPNLTGSLAINFEQADEEGKMHALYDVKAPVTMLVFYSPLCDHCKELMPRIYQTYLDYTPKGLQALALNTDKQPVYWKKFVTQQGWQWIDLANPDGIENLEKQFAAVNLPVIYLLDKDKRIVAKRIQPDKLGEALSRMAWEED